MFGIPTFDLTSDRGKQEFIEYIVNLTRKEINSYTPSYNISTGSSLQGDLIGDVTSTGLATSIASNVIVNADVNTSAAIAYSKLNLTGAILNADLAGSIDPTKITGTAVITSDSRLTDARTPTSHAATHIPGGADVLDYSKIVGYGTALPTFSASLHPVGVLFAVNTIGEPYSLYRSDGSAFKQVGGGGASGIPVGTIIHTGQGTIPAGFLDCDGSSQLRSLYPALFAAIGTTFGAGASPGTTFALPLVTGTYGNFVILADAASVVITTQTLIGAPIATLQLFAGSVYPTGYLRADGTAISRTSYADLFAVIGTTYGVGDGSTTFNLPNLLSSGSPSPVYIMKVSLSGTVEPSTIVHASSHIRAGTDVIDGDRVQVDFTPTYYTRDSTPTEAGATTDLTAHLKGLDNRIQKAIAVSNINQTVLTAQPSIVNVTTYTDITGFAVTITPTFSNSKILVDVQLGHGSPGNTDLFFRLLRGSTVINSGSGGSLVDSSMYGKGGDVYEAYHKTIRFLDSPATTSALTYKVQWRSYSNGTFYLNRRGQDNAFSFVSSITVQEIPVW